MRFGARNDGVKMFKIFYSWQSDLPRNLTRSFIKTCIDEAIKLAQDTEAIEAVRDEATLGVTGSPDIVTTLFSKIDECDLFIADVSLCFTENDKKRKHSPNPNVMLEMGYAVKTLGWERVICISNTDFGRDFPFDFAHNRITRYSLDGKNRNDETNRISEIILSNIRGLRNASPRAKSGMAMHVLGTYDLDNKNVTNVLVPLRIEEQEGYISHNQELIENSRKLVEEVMQIKIEASKEGVDTGAEKETEGDPLKFCDHLTAKSFIKSETPVKIDVDTERAKIKKWLGIETDDALFDCGRLKQRIQIFGGNEEYIGTDDEKQKYDKLTELFNDLTQLDLRSMYLKTFVGLQYIPLAIQNVSLVEDRNIRIVVHVITGEIVEPVQHLICEQLEGHQGRLCRDEDENTGIGIIDELFDLPEDGNIQIEEISYDTSTLGMQTPALANGSLWYSGKNEEDYENELQDHIALSSGDNYYEFEVKCLRPSEVRWLSQGMLIKPDENGITLRYRIQSSNTSGDLSGVLKT